MQNMKRKSLKESCRVSGLSLYQLSRLSGISVSQLYAIEKDPTRNVGVKTLEKIYLTAKIKPVDYLDVNIF